MAMDRETVPLLHPAQFPGAVNSMASRQTIEDHQTGSSLSPKKVGSTYTGKHRQPLKAIPKR